MAIIQAHGLTKHYRVHQRGSGFSAVLRSLWHREHKTIQAVNGIDFGIDHGEIVGFLGPNGAGKTTTLKMLSGLLHPTAGTARVLGHEPWLRQEAYLRQIALVMGQKGQLWWDVPAMDSYLINKEIYQVPDDVFRQRLNMLSELLDLEPLLGVQIRQLSLGERMKCELAGALLHGPQVLFLDEPTIGLDVTMQKRLRDFIRDYNQLTGATILLTSHYMDDIEELCQRVLIIHHGHLIYDGSLAQVVARYAEHRRLNLAFESQVPIAELEEVGEIVEAQPPRVVLRVPRNQATAVAAQLLNRFPVADLTIEEMPIEEIIRRIFQNDTTGSGLSGRLEP